MLMCRGKCGGSGTDLKGAVNLWYFLANGIPCCHFITVVCVHVSLTTTASSGKINAIVLAGTSAKKESVKREILCPSRVSLQVVSLLSCTMVCAYVLLTTTADLGYASDPL